MESINKLKIERFFKGTKTLIGKYKRTQSHNLCWRRAANKHKKKSYSLTSNRRKASEAWSVEEIFHFDSRGHDADGTRVTRGLTPITTTRESHLTRDQCP